MVLNPYSYKDCDENCDHDWKVINKKGKRGRIWRKTSKCTKCGGIETYRNPSI